jgi:hypothetical protein
MSSIDDEITRLEKEQEEEDKINHAPSLKTIPKPSINPSLLFPSLLKNSIRAKEELEATIKAREAAPTLEIQVKEEEIEENIEIPEEDTRESEQTAEQAVLRKAAESEYEERLNDCGFCGLCQQCKVYIYNSYKAEVINMGLVQIEDRINMHKKACITAIERERVCRDLWEDKLKKESEEIQNERRDADGRYIIPEAQAGKRISKGARDAADRKKPAKRISQDSKMANKLQSLGIDFKSLLMTMANAAAKHNNQEKK